MVTSKTWLGASAQGFGFFGVLWDRTVAVPLLCGEVRVGRT